MTKNKTSANDKKSLSLDSRIRKIIDESWIAPVYFSAAITELLNKFNAMTDDELSKYMEGFVAPATAREHVKEIYCKLNNIDNE